MRSPRRFALAVLVALTAGELVTWAFVKKPNPFLILRAVQLAVLAFAVARRTDRRESRLAPGAILGALVLEELYLTLYSVTSGSRWHTDWSRLWNFELIVLALARGFGLYLAARGERRWIDGLLLAGPVVVVELLLTFKSAIQALGDNFSVGVVTPHLGEVLAWGAVVAVLLPLVAGRQRA